MKKQSFISVAFIAAFFCLALSFTGYGKDNNACGTGCKQRKISYKEADLQKGVKSGKDFNVSFEEEEEEEETIVSESSKKAYDEYFILLKKTRYPKTVVSVTNFMPLIKKVPAGDKELNYLAARYVYVVALCEDNASLRKLSERYLEETDVEEILSVLSTKCPYCQGSGERKCVECKGTGKCKKCLGKGNYKDSRFVKAGDRDKYGYRYGYYERSDKTVFREIDTDCSVCRATGKCLKCGGEGMMKCCQDKNKYSFVNHHRCVKGVDFARRELYTYVNSKIKSFDAFDKAE